MNWRFPALAACRAACNKAADTIQETSVKPEELKKLDAYFKKTFNNQSIQVKARPRKDDSAEVFLGEDFLGLVYRDDEDGDLSYNFSMAILDVDLE